MRQILVQNFQIFGLCNQMGFCYNQISNTTPVHFTDCLISHMMFRLKRLKAVCHSTHAQDGSRRYFPNLPLNLSNICDARRRWVPKSTKSQKWSCITIITIMLTATSIRIQPYTVFAFVSFATSYFFVKTLIFASYSSSSFQLVEQLIKLWKWFPLLRGVVPPYILLVKHPDMFFTLPRFIYSPL